MDIPLHHVSCSLCPDASVEVGRPDDGIKKIIVDSNDLASKKVEKSVGSDESDDEEDSDNNEDDSMVSHQYCTHYCP